MHIVRYENVAEDLENQTNDFSIKVPVLPVFATVNLFCIYARKMLFGELLGLLVV